MLGPFEPHRGMFRLHRVYLLDLICQLCCSFPSCRACRHGAHALMDVWVCVVVVRALCACFLFPLFLTFLYVGSEGHKLFVFFDPSWSLIVALCFGFRLCAVCAVCPVPWEMFFVAV
jgi:hypothetical protein